MAVILFKWLIVSFFSAGFSPAKVSLPSPANEKMHPYFVSVTQIAHNQKQKSLEISCKVFADDFELALKKKYKIPFDLSVNAKEQQNDKFIKEYISQNLSFTINGAFHVPDYIGYEREGEAVYVYFEGSGIASIKKLSIENNILQDYTDKQINIVHASINGKRQSTKLDHHERKAVFNF